MENIVNQKESKLDNNLEISCGNCWGHQEYSNEYVGKSIDHTRDKKDNFISRFVKKYIRKTK